MVTLSVSAGASQQHLPFTSTSLTNSHLTHTPFDTTLPSTHAKPDTGVHNSALITVDTFPTDLDKSEPPPPGSPARTSRRALLPRITEEMTPTAPHPCTFFFEHETEPVHPPVNPLIEMSGLTGLLPGPSLPDPGSRSSSSTSSVSPSPAQVLPALMLILLTDKHTDRHWYWHCCLAINAACTFSVKGWQTLQ